LSDKPKLSFKENDYIHW